MGIADILRTLRIATSEMEHTASAANQLCGSLDALAVRTEAALKRLEESSNRIRAILDGQKRVEKVVEELAGHQHTNGEADFRRVFEPTTVQAVKARQVAEDCV